MRFITAIVLITLSDLAVCRPDFGDRITSTKTADSVRQKLDLNEYLSSSNKQPVEKLRPFQITNSQQKNIVKYATEQLSSIYTPLNIKPFSSEQHSPMPYSTPRPNIQFSSIYVPQNFSDFTFYNPQSSQLSYMKRSPPNCSESSPNCSMPQLVHSDFSLKFSNLSNSMKLKGGLGGGTGPSMGIDMQDNKPVNKTGLKPIGSITVAGQPDYFPRSPRFSRPLEFPTFPGMPGMPGSSKFSGSSQSPGGYPGGPGISVSSSFSGPSGPSRPSELPGLSGPSGPSRFPGTYISSEFSGYNYPRPKKLPSSLYTPPSIGGYPSGQSSTPFSTQRPSKQLSSTYLPQDFRGSTSYNPRPSQPSYFNAGSLAFPPLNLPESSSTYLPPQPPVFPSISPRPPPSESGKPPTVNPLSLGRGTGIDSGIQISENTLKDRTSLSLSNAAANELRAINQPGIIRIMPSGYLLGTSGSSRPPGPSGPPPTRYPSPGYPSPIGGSTSMGGYSITGRPFPPFTTPKVGISPGGNVDVIGEGPRTTETAGADSTVGTGETTGIDDDLSHPPHIHSLDVQCSKTMMTINIEFNRAFDGIIYSKGYFMNPECIYVRQNSGSTQYSFSVSLDSCGTQFINDFAGAAGQAYLENTLVLQNEPGVQEVWDTVRRVRCLWEGNINKTVTVNLSVDMLPPEIVTFNGDTATARLDIQIGKGPFAPAADGLVKIGETMTLVVSVEGDSDFDLQVRDCLARDKASTSILQLTDKRGCILKPKLMGAFQKTNITGNTGASIIAYAFFQAFKFPDVMDLFIECNIELCKTNCDPCPEANQHIEPGRRRRSVTYAPSSNNSTSSVMLSDPIRVGRRLKVIMLDDLSTASSQILDSMEEAAVEAMTKTKEICVNNREF